MRPAEKRTCQLWEAKESYLGYVDYGGVKRNCGTCRYYVYDAGRCTRESELLKEKRPS